MLHSDTNTKTLAELLKNIETHEPTPEERAKWKRDEELMARQREYDDKLRVQEINAAAGLPERYADACLKNFVSESVEQEKLLSELHAYAQGIDRNEEASMALIGPVGTGKTWIGCALVNEVLKFGSAAYITAKRYTGLIRESYRNDSKMSELAILDRYAKKRLLVLDEIGRQFDTEAEKLYLFDLIDERYRNRLPTVFLSNLSPEEFRKFLGEAIVDRIREGGGKIKLLNWASRRGQTTGRPE
jgi:DNA replication protein DnaC